MILTRLQSTLDDVTPDRRPDVGIPAASRVVIHDLDILELHTGHLLTAYGSHEGPFVRARLSYLPNEEGKPGLSGRRFEKIIRQELALFDTEVRLLNSFPGEQQFLVPRSKIANVYPPLPAEAAGLSANALEWREQVAATLKISERRIAVGGGRSLGMWNDASDVDWIVYLSDSAPLRQALREDPLVRPSFHFGMNNALAKWGAHRHLSHDDIRALFDYRWRHFERAGEPMSAMMVNLDLRGDDLVELPPPGSRMTVRGTLASASGCDVNPRWMTLRSGTQVWTLLTWTFLYHGGLKEGQAVEVSGRLYKIRGQDTLVIDHPDDYIRPLDDERAE